MLESGISTLACLILLMVAWAIRRPGRRRPTLPPSPPGHWLWGNVAEMNTSHRAVKAATDWKGTYGGSFLARDLLGRK